MPRHPHGLCWCPPTFGFRRHLTWALVPSYSAFMQARIYSSTSPFSRVDSLGLWHRTGLRLHALRRFAVFLASIHFLSSACIFLFCSTAPLPWRRAFSWAAPFSQSGRSFLAFGSNQAVKPTRLRRVAYFRR